MRYVAAIPNTVNATWTQEAADSLVGQRAPFRIPAQEPHGDALVLSARVDDVGLHLELEIEADAPLRQQITNLTLYGSTHGPHEVLPVEPEFSIGTQLVTGEVDPLLRIGCVLPSSALDDPAPRHALREIVRAATKRFRAEHP